MKALGNGRKKNIYASILVLSFWMIALAFVVLYTHPVDAPRAPVDTSIVKTASVAVSEHDTMQDKPAFTGDTGVNPAKWTFMVYIDSDDSSLEEQAISDFIEMAAAGSNEDVNIVMQFDRSPEYDTSYGDWTDCRRFLITDGLTPADGNELMNLGEANMGDPATLVDFAEWAASNYPAEKYALIISSHGKGWEGCCWDESSGNDKLDLRELGNALYDISQFTGRPLDIIGFDACLMGMTEVAYEVRDYASIMVASEHAEPSSGWPYDAILSKLVETPDMDAVFLATVIVDNYYSSHAPKGYTMAAINLNEIDPLVESLNNLAQAMVVRDSTDESVIKEYASSVIAAQDAAVICEKHGTNWDGSHGLAIYFPKSQEKFNSTYNADAVSLASDTAWEEFLLGYFTYADDDWIISARTATQQYYYKEHIDLYNFCQLLIGE